MNIKSVIKWVKDSLKSPDLDADTAYSLSQYGKYQTPTQQINEAVKSIKDLIAMKVASGDTSLIFELVNHQHDYTPFKLHIIGDFRNRNFFVKEVDIMNNNYLFISWKPEHTNSK